MGEKTVTRRNNNKKRNPQLRAAHKFGKDNNTKNAKDGI